MSQFSGQRQQTTEHSDGINSQGFDTTPTTNVHPNLNLFFPSDGLGLISKEECNNESSGESLSQKSQSSNESNQPSSSMEVAEDDNTQYHRPPHLAIIIPNYFHHQQGNQQGRQINEYAVTNNSSGTSNSSSGDSVILLESRGVQTDFDNASQNSLIDESQANVDRGDDDEEYFDADQNQYLCNLFSQI